ncbi:hypothetical protein [Streptomyces subrutilus]|uniref:Uncharacterized protein n=1 Tax=Streptomyces subrutilus TaxID=36818 RepID=A0A5P2UR65_9ACTN|nr:hypothetical protein [Streptomyces subrutilus]QEU80081.1 hypothetical protein CP968_18775 [Streptomyces subrutilus]WSJ30650.1 hypothetical protein OG479_15865 [Streptomyces subrutilus]GGZ50630.1 hypothetical protein GCM10010371_07800 [Streptomyces subrutilus]
MNRRIRLAVMTPLIVSSLALGSASLLSSSAHAATPSLTCSVKKSGTTGKFDVNVSGAQPGVRVTIKGGNSTASSLADDSGKASTAGFIPVGAVTAQQKNTKVTCGTVKQAEQKDAQSQFSTGFRKGFADSKADCKKEGPPQGIAPLDANFVKGYNAGAQAAIDKFC